MTKRLGNIALVLAGLIAGFVAVWPALYLVLVHANLSSFYQENIGYHFFWVLRMVDGVPSDVVIPQQGVLFSLIQAIFYLIGKALGLDLYGMIDLFALLTLAVPAVAMIALAVAIARDEKIDAGVRAVLIAAPLVISFGGPQLFTYVMYPDYLAYGKFGVFLFSWRWLHHRGSGGFASRRAAIELAVITGLLAAFKPNYVVVPAGLILWSLLAMQPERRREAIRMAVTIGSWSFITFAACFVLHYKGDLGRIVKFFDWLLKFSASLSSAANDFTLHLIPPATPAHFHDAEVTLSWLLVILALA